MGIVTVITSGKGGVGKSTVAAGLGLLWNAGVAGSFLLIWTQG